jgi:hypothetical protein
MNDVIWVVVSPRNNFKLVFEMAPSLLCCHFMNPAFYLEFIAFDKMGLSELATSPWACVWEWWFLTSSNKASSNLNSHLLPPTGNHNFIASALISPAYAGSRILFNSSYLFRGQLSRRNYDRISTENICCNSIENLLSPVCCLNTQTFKYIKL